MGSITIARRRCSNLKVGHKQRALKNSMKSDLINQVANKEQINGYIGLSIIATPA
jgi:hypothetical protein